MNCAECGSVNVITVTLPNFWRTRTPGTTIPLCKDCVFTYVAEAGLGHACWNCGQITSSMYCMECYESQEENLCDECGSDEWVTCADCTSHDDCSSEPACSNCGVEAAEYCSGCASCDECGDMDDNMCKTCRACNKCGKAKACPACDTEVPIEIIDGEAQVGDVIVRFQN